MSIYTDINDHAISLRKSHDPMGSFLNMVVGKVKLTAKEKRVEISDDLTIATLRSFIKMSTDALSFGSKTAEQEINLLNSFLPSEPSNEELRNSITEFLKDKNMDKPMALMGPCLKHLTEAYGVSLNKATASQIIKSILQNDTK